MKTETKMQKLDKGDYLCLSDRQDRQGQTRQDETRTEAETERKTRTDQYEIINNLAVDSAGTAIEGKNFKPKQSCSLGSCLYARTHACKHTLIHALAPEIIFPGSSPSVRDDNNSEKGLGPPESDTSVSLYLFTI